MVICSIVTTVVMLLKKCLVAVSYTHLDVYKRQTLCWEQIENKSLQKYCYLFQDRDYVPYRRTYFWTNFLFDCSSPDITVPQEVRKNFLKLCLFMLCRCRVQRSRHQTRITPAFQLYCTRKDYLRLTQNWVIPLRKVCLHKRVTVWRDNVVYTVDVTGDVAFVIVGITNNNNNNMTTTTNYESVITFFR